jgi:hypothetical protein
MTFGCGFLGEKRWSNYHEGMRLQASVSPGGGWCFS